jgi:hypothetical protein
LWYTKFPIYGTAKNSLSIKKIEKVIWETLSKTCFADEKLAWGDQVATREFELDEEFHTPTRSPMKESTITSPQPRPN